MKKKKILLIVVISLIIIAGLSAIFIITNKTLKENNNNIQKGYIAIFHGGSGERTNETYIYKQDNGHNNYGFDYINVTSTTKSWGSSERTSKITKRGSVQWTDDVFTVAKNNNAYDYVTLPNSDKTYTIKQYQKMFIMN